MADEKIIFSMNGVSKILPHNNKAILKDIYLGFFYGAKIGIIGLNGAGKSTVLKIHSRSRKTHARRGRMGSRLQRRLFGAGTSDGPRKDSS